MAALFMHDVPEDTSVTGADIEREFGKEIAGLVDGVTKLGHVRLRNSKEPQYIETLRKMFVATSKDVRVMIIKLADRLHNIRTIEHLPEDKQKKIATETLEIYAPIAARLGINTWKDELEDRSFAIVDPKEYQATKHILDEELSKKEHGVKVLQKEIGHVLKTEGVKFLDITGRTKRVYSLYKKLKKYHGDLDKVSDIVALRVITRASGDCYGALGAIHQHFQPVPGRIKDFIATPKPNGYQSLHTTVFDRKGSVFEIQIRTDLMHEEADRGVAAHWFYSQSGKVSQRLDNKFGWINELRSWQDDDQSGEEFMESLKIDFFKDRIFVLTPKGDAKDLPVGATVIDFAFSVHTDLGFYMMGAKINGKMSKITQTLEQGDVVEILKSKQPVKVSRDWMAAAHTSHARGRIRQYLNEHDKSIVQRVRELKLANFTLPTFFRKK
jgi:GTP pyrophosphokinase